jgi:hypothetical protein
MMKRTTLKLVIRRETVRVLAELDLGRVVGGSPDPQLMDTGGGANNTCVQAAVVAQAALPAKP